MDVKFNLIQSATRQINQGKNAVPANNHIISDSISLGGTPEALPEKPVFSSVTSSVPPSLNLTSAMTFHNAAASSITPAPFGPALTEQLQNLSYGNVEFFAKRKFHIPFIMSPYKEISSSKAEEALRQNIGKGEPVVFASIKKQTPLPITDQKELDRMTAYSESGKAHTNQDILMGFLKSAEEDGFYINISGSKVSGGYAAYKYLTGIGDDLASPGKNVDISSKGVTLFSVGSKDLSDVKDIKRRFDIELSRFRCLDRNEKLYNTISEPPSGVSEDDKQEILSQIYNNSRGETEKKQVSRTLEQYNLIRNSAKNEKEFTNICNLYKEFLAERNSSYWDDKNQVNALKFIIEDLKDRPEDFKQFITLTGLNIPVAGTIKIFRNLPQPPKPGEYKKTSDIIVLRNLNKEEHVDLLMKPAGDSTLEERVDVLNGLNKYSDSSYSDKAWKNTVKGYDLIRKFSTNPGDFAKIGKMCIEMLKANNDTYWRDEYKSAIKFVATKLKDRPEDFKTFIDLLNKRTSLKSAMEIFHNLPSSSKKMDFDKAAEAFKGSTLRKSEQITYLMEPIGDTTLEERISIAEDIFEHTNGSYSDNQWKYCKKEFENLKSLSKDGREFVKIGGMFVDMLKANKDSYWKKNYSDGMKVIAGELQDKPDDFKTFIDIIQYRRDIDAAIEIYKNTSSGDKNGTYQEAADIFRGASITQSEQIAEVMKPLGNVSLKDRMEIIEGIYKHSEGSYSEDHWKNAIKEYNRLKSLCPNDADFVKVGKMFTEMLDTTRETYWQKSYAEGMELIASDLKDKPEHFDSFIKMIRNKMTIPAAAKAYKMLPEAQKTGKLENTAELLKSSQLKSREQVELLMEPVGSSSLEERIEILEGIYNHSEASYSEDHWKNALKEYNRLKSLCPNGTDFVKVGKMFTEMLKANRESYWMKSYAEGMELIASELKDKPEHFAGFIKMISDRMSIPAAVKAYKMLPEAQKTGKLENTADVLKSSRLKSTEQVELLMEPVGSSSLKDRIEIVEGIHRHTDSSYSSDSWNYTVKTYKLLKSLAKKDDNFVKLGKLFVQFLDANRDSYYRSSYNDALRFIAGNLMDKPDEFNTILEMLNSKFSIGSVMKLHEVLPENHTKEELEKAASSFKSTDLKSPGQIELFMKPIENTTLDERIKIGEVIYNHCCSSESETTQKRMVSEYQHLKEITARSNDFTKVGKMFGEMLETKNDRYYRPYNRTGLDFISLKLKDSPENFKTFINLVQNNCSIDSAKRMYDLLPQPVKPEEFSKIAKIFMDRKFMDADCIELTMNPVGDLSLEDRVDIASGIYNHVQGSESADTVKNMKKFYNRLISGTSGSNEFAKISKLFIQVLEASNSRYMRNDYSDALNFVISDLKNNPDLMNHFETFVKAAGISLAMEAARTIREPVKGENLDTRAKAAKKILGENFKLQYTIASRNIPSGETIEDSAALLSAIQCMPGNNLEIAKNEPVLQMIQQSKGSLKGAQIEKLVKVFSLDNIDNLVKAIKTLDLPGDNDSYETRQDLFLKMSTEQYGVNQYKLSETTELFQTVYNGKLEKESFSQALSRFGQIMKFYMEKKQGDPKEVRDIYLRLMDELKKGTFRQQTPDQVTDKLLQILLVANTIESAFDQLIYASKQQEDKTIIRGENEITIGGVKLKKAKRK